MLSESLPPGAASTDRDQADLELGAELETPNGSQRQTAAIAPIALCEVTPYGLTMVSGVTNVVLTLAHGLRELGHQVWLVAPGLPPPDLPRGIEAWTVGLDGPLLNWRFSARVAHLLVRRRTVWEIVHVHQAHISSLIAVIAARTLGKAAVGTFHSVPPPGRGFRGLSARLAQRLLPMLLGESI